LKRELKKRSKRRTDQKKGGGTNFPKLERGDAIGRKKKSAFQHAAVIGAKAEQHGFQVGCHRNSKRNTKKGAGSLVMPGRKETFRPYGHQKAREVQGGERAIWEKIKKKQLPRKGRISTGSDPNGERKHKGGMGLVWDRGAQGVELRGFDSKREEGGRRVRFPKSREAVRMKGEKSFLYEK